jgi:RHS repeat-associated protein
LPRGRDARRAQQYHTYSALTNRLTDSGTSYDANGNLTAMPGLGMSYDVQNRLIQAAPTSGGSEWFVYNPWNQKVWSSNSGYYGAYGAVTMYGPNGEPLADFAIWASSFYVPTGVCYDSVGNVLSSCLVLQSEHLYFAGQKVDIGSAYDRLGTAVMAGGSTTPKSFYPYGELKSGAPATEFATYQRDSNTNLDYANNRWYSSQIARFTTPDPYDGSAAPQTPQSWNRYAYAGGDPINKNDPSGLCHSDENGNYWDDDDGKCTDNTNTGGGGGGYTVYGGITDAVGYYGSSPADGGAGVNPGSDGTGHGGSGVGSAGGSGTSPAANNGTTPMQTRQQCIQSVLQDKFGNFIGNKVIPEFSLYSLGSLSSAWSFLRGSAVSLGIKGVVVGGPWAYGRILTATGQNLAAYQGLLAASADALEAGAFWTTTAATGGTILAGGVAAVTAFSTGADHWARQQCQNLP